jgi:hypothetical protein
MFVLVCGEFVVQVKTPSPFFPPSSLSSWFSIRILQFGYNELDHFPKVKVKFSKSNSEFGKVII